ncbi:Bud site selection [Balamuthia mandrillaris]
MGRNRPKRTHKDDKSHRKRWSTKKRAKDVDQIYEEMKKGRVVQVLDLDLPGKGQFYCPHCHRYFIGEEAMKTHFKTKLHKKRLKELQEKPYLGPAEEGIEKVDNGPKLSTTPF